MEVEFLGESQLKEVTKLLWVCDGLDLFLLGFHDWATIAFELLDTS